MTHDGEAAVRGGDATGLLDASTVFHGTTMIGDNNRNLTDEQFRAIAKNGGVIGIGYWSTATCGKDAKSIAAAIKHAVDVAGIDHVGLGSGCDGAVAHRSTRPAWWSCSPA